MSAIRQFLRERLPLQKRTIHKALLLPEIVSCILRNGADTENLLFNCLLINRLFFQEAARILWKGCGARYERYWPTPNILHLVKIVAEDVNRAQIYANEICILNFEEDWEADDAGLEAKHHPQLTQLTFPRLQEVAFFRTQEDSSGYNTGANIAHYVQPKLKKFDVCTSSKLSNVLLEALSSKCSSGLRYLKLRVSEGESSITPSQLNSFLRHMRLLKVLDITSLEWNFETLQEASRLSQLELLVSPPIHDDWLPKLYNAIHPFPSLTSLETSLSDDAIADLHHVCPRLQHLQLTVQASNHHLLRSASTLTELKELTLDGPIDEHIQWIINGSDLICFAENCKTLREISIGQDEIRQRPTATDLNDSIMDMVAQNLPDLKDLEFHYNSVEGSSTIPLTNRTLLSLSKHCRKLECLNITCSMDWKALLYQHPLDAISFPNLWSLEIRCHPETAPLSHEPAFGQSDEDFCCGTVDSQDSEDEFDPRWEKLVKAVTGLATNMTYFAIVDGVGYEDELDSEVGIALS